MKKHIILLISSSFFLFSACATLNTKSENSSDSKITKTAEELLSEMTLEEKVGQLFVIQPDQLDLKFGNVKNYKYWKSLPASQKINLQKYPVGGFIIFGGNIKSEKQLKALNGQLKAACKIEPFMAVDEEGGRVTRLAKTKSLGLKNVDSMEEIGSTGDIKKARQAGQYIGSYLYDYGFNWDFAPVTDVNTNPENRVIGNRAFGSDPNLVADMAGAYLDGLHSHKVMGCIKHFPGHGDTKDDTHVDFVYVAKNWDELKQCELIPFVKNLKKADSVMMAHVTVPAVSGEEIPASLSTEMIVGKLRGELGYKGLILTDSLGMGAIKKHYGAGNAAVMAFNAGNDIILMPAEFYKAWDGMLEACRNGEISEKRLNESVLRILKTKGY